MSHKSGINRVRTLYAIMLGLIGLVIVMVVLSVVLPDGREDVMVVPESRYALRITNIDAPADIYRRAEQLGGEEAEQGMVARVSSFDLDVPQADLRDARVVWATILQVVSALLMLVAVGMVLHVLIAFYVSTKRGKVFPLKNITKLRWVGILVITLSLLSDFSLWLERSYAYDLLEGSEWQPNISITIHFTRLLLGLVLVFMAEILSIGRQMQDEQELTI